MMEFSDIIRTSTVENVCYLQNNGKCLDGTLCITSHHLIFSCLTNVSEECWVLHQNVDAVEYHQVSPTIGRLILKCKDFRILKFEIPDVEECCNIADSIEILSNIVNARMLYPFFYHPMYAILEDGWQTFKLELELATLIKKSNKWKISYVNNQFKICSTYPEAVIVPKEIEDEILCASALFRQGGRFPVLSYHHNNGAVLLRSGQPMVGNSGRRCKEDERLLNASLHGSGKGYIIDLRMENAVDIAKANGGGSETEAYYPQWKKIYKYIEASSILLMSLGNLVEACNDTECSVDRWIGKLEASNWLTYVQESLNCALMVANLMHQENSSVLVHDTNGMDSTLLITSLTQILLGPDCRTVSGLQALIDREWLQGGYPFATRHRYSCYNVGRSRNSYPVFLMFLDCIWQIMQKFPCSFEFNEILLLQLFQHSYSSQFGKLNVYSFISSNLGTFLGDNMSERVSLQLVNKTTSLWSHLNSLDILPQILNPLYEPYPQPLNISFQSITLWTGLFLPFSINESAKTKKWNIIANFQKENKELCSKITKIRKELVQLENQAKSRGLLTF